MVLGNTSNGQGLTLPNDSVIAGSFTVEASTPPTPAELAEPPSGEFKKYHLRNINIGRENLARHLVKWITAPGGAPAPWGEKAQALKAAMDAVAQTRKTSDFIGLIPLIKEFMDRREVESSGDFAFDVADIAIGSLSADLIQVIAQHVKQSAANVDAATLSAFVTVFSTRNFIQESDWEEKEAPMDSGGAFVLNAAAVVTQLKALPWSRAEQFIGNRTFAQIFERYESSGGGLPVLKLKYAANKAIIQAKFNELRTWVDQQRGTPD
jgi:hypothetical protein